ncbi:MAG: ATP-dependent DNA helicase RecG [Ghiorsea sp.]|nr:ATP-dependent DNA helicase RecG [Ghiorsea sp.]
MPIQIYPSFYMPIERVDTIGPVAAKKLQSLGYSSLGSLLFHLPKSWIDDRTITPINMLQAKQEARIVGVIQSKRSVGRGRKSTIFITLADESGINIQLSFFHANYMMRDARLQEGQTITVRGTPDKWGNQWQMTHPDWLPIAHLNAGFIPQYASLAGYHGKKIGGWIKKGLQFIAKEAESPLDVYLPDQPSLVQALRFIHTNAQYAPNSKEILQAFTRLQLEELLVYLQLMQHQRKKAAIKTTVLAATNKEQQFIDSLPFELTDAQQHVWQEISRDLASGQRMHRLLQGDVGAGKTWVAALGMVRLAAHGRQSSIMAPTEVLAQQHLETLKELLEPHHISVALLTGSTKKRERNTTLKALAAGHIDVLVGTHALLTHDVVFQDLGLAMIDEQHRFGVQQRWALSEKNTQHAVHLLAMTATPIPRSLALALYGDMHLSIMQGLPKGRKPIETRMIYQDKLPALADAIERMLEKNGRVYWVVPRIDEDDDSISVDERLATLQKRFPNENILGLHGKMKSKAKQEALSSFADGSCRILVSTTVIEVGVNVPEARVMIIEHAEMYGLAQLHQLRGRVGRSDLQSFCMLIPSQKTAATERLNLMTTCHDGLILAESDLKHRGAGDAVGTRQSGEAGFKLIDPALDADFIRQWCASPILGQLQNLSEDIIRFWRPLATPKL